MKFLVVNGPNLNMLGIREPGIYGDQNYAALVKLIEDTCAAESIDVDVFQSNHEGAIVDRIQAAFGNTDGIVINPAAYTHTSVAILDALKAVAIPPWKCISPMYPPARTSARFPMPAWPASRPTWASASRATGRQSFI